MLLAYGTLLTGSHRPGTGRNVSRCSQWCQEAMDSDPDARPSLEPWLLASQGSQRTQLEWVVAVVGVGGQGTQFPDLPGPINRGSGMRLVSLGTWGRNQDQLWEHRRSWIIRFFRDWTHPCLKTNPKIMPAEQYYSHASSKALSPNWASFSPEILLSISSPTLSLSPSVSQL